MPEADWHGASFRDPSGHIFTDDSGNLLRTVTLGYAEHYDALMGSGLYDDLVGSGRLVAHEELPSAELDGQTYHRLLKPALIPFISYPWEWSFSQLRDAALLTLDIAWTALDRGMVLKDASAFNVQFVGSKPVFIDTLSFEKYVDGEPWVAYRQFCQHFLAPLELRARVHPSLANLCRTNLDGVPLDLAARLLPKSSMLKPGTLLHVHAHGRAQQKYSDSEGAPSANAVVSKRSLYALLDSLRSAVTGCSWNPKGTEWCDYYEDTNYSDASMDNKIELVDGFLARTEPQSVWDLGANTGRFSRLAVERGAYTVAFDIDPAAVEKAYRGCRGEKSDRLLPLVMDLMNPTPGLGWALRERDSFVDRGSPDVTLALALIHHLAIGQNVPLGRIASFLAALGPWLVIEFVPKSDSQVKRMLSSRRDIFSDYHREGFERAFSQFYETDSVEPVAGTDRVLYLLRSKSDGRGERTVDALV
jgi:ribosomal protein L11 methylase PrmA